MFQERKKITWAKKEKKRNPLILRIIFDILLIAFAGISVYVLFFSSYLKINRLILEGIQELDYESVVAQINSNLEGQYFKAIPHNNFILFSERRLKRDLKDKFKKIESVEAKKKFPDTIMVKITERKALMLWCSFGPCYIVDEKGFAYSEADFESPEIKENNLIRLADVSAQPVNLGEKVLDPEYIQFVLSIKEKIREALDIEISEEYFTKSAVAQEVQVKTNEGWDTYFNSQLPISQSIETLKIFLDEKMNGIERGKLEYVDLRIGNKVYYKFKDGENIEVNGVEQTPSVENSATQPDKEDKKTKKKK